MKRTIIKISLFILLFCCFLALSTTSHANNIKSIDIDVYIDGTGSANVTEVWKANLNEGTEGYKPYGDLGNCKITNFTVKDDTGAVYHTEEYWSTSGTLSDKKHKCGINYTTDGLELCWGISEYGNRTYTLNYKITNFVNQYTDCQGINFYFMPHEMEQNVNSVTLKISSVVPFSEVYGFGFKGTTELQNGALVIKTDKKFKDYNYLIAVGKFDGNYFPSGNFIDSTFADDLKSTEDFAKKLERDRIRKIIIAIITMGLAFIATILIAGFIYVHTAPELAFEGDKKIPVVKKSDYWREVPCFKDLFKAYWIGTKYNVITDKSGLIGGILLTWVKKGYITVTKNKKGLFSLKDNNYAIDFTQFSLDKLDNDKEKELAEYFIKASGENLILEPKEFETYCRIHYTTLEKWFEDCIKVYTDVFVKEGFITKQPLEKKFLFLHKIHSVNTATLKLKDEAIRLQGLKHFLLDYSLINEREAIEVQLWEEYLIFASLLAIADKVSEQFSKLYPNMNELSNLNTDFTTLAVTNMSHSGYTSAHSAYTSSSGGHSGGGGSHGGSYGGGFR